MALAPNISHNLLMWSYILMLQIYSNSLKVLQNWICQTFKIHKLLKFLLTHCLNATADLPPKLLSLWHPFFPKSKLILSIWTFLSFIQLTFISSKCAFLCSVIHTRVLVVMCTHRVKHIIILMLGAWCLLHVLLVGKIRLICKSVLLIDILCTTILLFTWTK